MMESFRPEARTREPRSASRFARLLRLSLLLLLQPTRVRLSELAADFQTSRRTLLRDLKVLRGAGLCVSFDPEKKHYRIELDQQPATPNQQAVGRLAQSFVRKIMEREAQKQPDVPLPLTWEEAVALTAACRAVGVPSGTEWQQGLQGAERKLQRMVSQQFGKQADTVQLQASRLLSSANTPLGGSDAQNSPKLGRSDRSA